MRILLTGASGRLGSNTLRWLLARDHFVYAIDISPFNDLTTSQLDTLSPAQKQNYTFTQIDITDYKALQAFLKDKEIDGVIHWGAIPDPLTLDARVVHNNNVTASYNLLYTCGVEFGIKRIVQASSVNAMGLSYTPEGHHRFSQMPVTETHPMRPEDPYALSKAICELQATSLVRAHPGLRIASLRFHLVARDYADACSRCRWQDGFAWNTYDSASSAAYLSLTKEEWEGHEVFNITAPEICWEGGPSLESQSKVELEGQKKVGTLDLLDTFWKGRIDEDGFDRSWWDENPRRSTWDARKAERVLGWDHDSSGQLDK